MVRASACWRQQKRPPLSVMQAPAHDLAPVVDAVSERKAVAPLSFQRGAEYSLLAFGS